jgi:hypothetical protein
MTTLPLIGCWKTWKMSLHSKWVIFRVEKITRGYLIYPSWFSYLAQVTFVKLIAISKTFETHLMCVYIPDAPCMEYLPTFALKITQHGAYGYGTQGRSSKWCPPMAHAHPKASSNWLSDPATFSALWPSATRSMQRMKKIGNSQLLATLQKKG